MINKKDYHKDYYDKNRDKILAQSKEWYKNNKDKVELAKRIRESRNTIEQVNEKWTEGDAARRFFENECEIVRKGMPDLLIRKKIGDGYIYYGIELKRTGTLSSNQERCLEWLVDAGIPCKVIYEFNEIDKMCYQIEKIDEKKLPKEGITRFGGRKIEKEDKNDR